MKIHDFELDFKNANLHYIYLLADLVAPSFISFLSCENLGLDFYLVFFASGVSDNTDSFFNLLAAKVIDDDTIHRKYFIKLLNNDIYEFL